MTDAMLLLHVLWTKAVGTHGYKKREWQELERILAGLERREAKEDRRKKDRRMKRGEP